MIRVISTCVLCDLQPIHFIILGKCATAEIVDSKDIRSKFSFLLFHTMRSLITEKVLIQDLKVLLLPYKTSELNESDDDVRKILLKAFHNCSFFSFKIVRDIIDHLGTNDDKERLAKYEESFKDYCKDGVPTEVPLEEVCVIQSEISRILGKPIHLKGMNEGGIFYIFYIWAV